MVDVNYIAIKLAKKNAKLNGVENRTIILKSDIFDNVPVDVKFNAIYSNPPLSKGVDFLKNLKTNHMID